MRSTDSLPMPRQRAINALSMRFFLLVALTLAIVAVASLSFGVGDRAQKCRFHTGGFSSGFSGDFDIDRIKCRSTSKAVVVIDRLRSFFAN